MYPGNHAIACPTRPAVVMAQTGETITYGELAARANRLAHLFRARGLRPLDHYAIFMENNARYVESCCAGECSGLYYTCVNSYLTPEEVVYIVANSESRILITSQAKRSVAEAALKTCPNVELCLIVDGEGDGGRLLNLDEATASYSATPIADEWLGTPMLYSSGTTGQPKGILRPLAQQHPSQQLPLFAFLQRLWQYRDGMIYLSPAPLYQPDDPHRRDRDHHGAVRPGALSAAGGDLQGHAQPACPEHVLAHAQAAGGRAAAP